MPVLISLRHVDRVSLVFIHWWSELICTVIGQICHSLAEASQVIMRTSGIVLTITGLLLAGCSSNDNSSFQSLPAPPSNDAMSSSGPGLAEPGAYRLSSGDRLSVVVFGEDQLSGEFVVGEDGFVNLPSLGAIPAAGQTITDFQNTLVSRYTIYVTDPKVTVSVLNSQ